MVDEPASCSGFIVRVGGQGGAHSGLIRRKLTAGAEDGEKEREGEIQVCSAGVVDCESSGGGEDVGGDGASGWEDLAGVHVDEGGGVGSGGGGDVEGPFVHSFCGLGGAFVVKP